MRTTSKRISFLINISVIICLFFTSFSPTPVFAQSSKSENITNGSFLLTGKNIEKQANKIQTSAELGNISLTSQVSNNLSVQSSYSIITCSENTDIIILSGQACSLDSGSYNFTSIVIENGGALIANGNTTSGQGVTISTGSLSVASGGVISADGKGSIV